MRDIFIADAHLRNPSDENYRRLIDFLKDQQGRIRTLYLMGDIFDFWVGYRHVVYSAYVPILQTLAELRSGGTRIVYVEGNHDFHLGPFFSETLGCRVLPDGGAIDLDGIRTYIAHGDLINPRDTGYHILRRLLRSLPLRILMRLFPPDWTWEIARWAGRQSGKTHHIKRERWVPREMQLAHAQTCFSKGYKAVVTGHFHAPLLEESEGGILLSLGDWIDQFSYGVWEDGKFRLERYNGTGAP